MNQYRSGGWLSQIPPVTRNLIIINVLLWAVCALMPSFGNTLINVLGLHYIGAQGFNPIQIITYMFMHDTRSIFHLLFNMFTLWMFGRVLEQVWGSRRYMVYYFICGMGAALVQEGVWALTWEHEYISGIAHINGLTYDSMQSVVEHARQMGDPRFLEGMAAYKQTMITIGASGAIYGLLLGFAFVFPNLPLYIMFIPVPIKAKWMVIGYGVIEFFLGISGSVSTVAHFAHLGGMIFGLLILLYWRHKGTLRGGGFYN